MRDLLEWIGPENPKLAEREAVKLLRRVFDEQFEGGRGKAGIVTQRPARAYRTPTILMRIMPIRRPSSGPATKCM